MSKKHMTKKITAFIMAFAFVTSTNYTNMILALESTSEMESVPIVYSEAEVKINLNGITENKYNLLNEIFEDVNISEIGKKRAKILFESESSLEDHLKINTEDFFNYGEIEYHVDDIIFNKNKVTINITEYYDISNFKMDEVSIYCEEVVSENNKYPYHSKMKISPNKGWKLNNNDDIYFYLLGDLNSSVRYVGDRCYFEVINGSEKLTSFAEKTRYTLSFEENNDIKILLNGKESLITDQVWLNDDNVTAEISTKNDDVLIKELSVVSSASGSKLSFENQNDGKNMFISINKEDLLDKYIDNVCYQFYVTMISNKISLPIFNEDEYLKDIECNLYMENGDVFLNFPSVIYEENSAKYMIDYYSINDGEDKKNIDLQFLYENGLLNEDISIKYNIQDGISLHYKEIIQDKGNEPITTKKSFNSNLKNVYVLKKSIVYDLLEVKFQSDINYFISYSILNDNNLFYNGILTKDIFKYIDNIYPQKLIFINVKSILYLDSAGFHNIIPEPLYFYIDDHAPIISVSNTPTDTYDNEKWSSNVYSFDISVDDKEFFQASDNNEINETYQKINGVASDISKINIGEYTFEKTGAGWNRIDNENINDEYEINIYDIADGKIRADVFLKEGKDFFEGTLEVSAEDKCGNISDIQYASVRMDSSGPVVSYIKLENIRGMNGKIIGTDGKNISVLFKAGDNISGIRSAVLEYGNFSADMNNGIKVSNEGNGYLFEVNGVISQDTEDKIKLTLTDNAGNESIYYYSKNEPVKNYEEAIDVIIDTAPPVCKASVENANFEDNGKKWFRVCPDINIFLSDKKGNVCSGIDSINISINGGKTKTISWLNETENNDYNIVFRKSENYIYDAVLVYKSGMEYLIGSINTKDENGKIYADVSVSDFAGNISDTSHIEFYLDTDEPVVDEIFKIKENNDNVRNFGAFFNKSITLEADVSEYGPSSGLKNAILEFAGEKYEYEFYNDKTAEFVIPFETGSIYGEPVIEVFDNAGNSSGKCKLISEKGSSDIIIEDRNPDIHGPAAERPAEYIDNENNKWYNSNINLTYRFTDADSKNIMNSGIKITDISLNGKQIIAENFSSGEIRLQEKAYTVNTSEADNSDGKFVFNVKTEDNSGNKNNSEYTIYTDITAPEITAFSIAGVRTAPDSLVNGIFVYSYGYFFKNETAVTVYAEDKNSSSGLREIVFTLIDSKGNIFKQMTTAGENIKYANGEYYTSFVIPEGFKGIVSAYAIDNVENVSETLSPEGFILESPGRHTQTSFIDISLPETAYKDQNGLPLYDSDVKVIFNANDSFSGIKKAEWNFSEYSDDIWRTIDVDNDGELKGNYKDKWKVTDTDKNLAVKINGEIISSSNENSASVSFKITDNAGNISSVSKSFSIDKNAPEIMVSYIGDAFNNIYKTERTAVIRIKERNFDEGKININVDGNQEGVYINRWTLAEGIAGTDSAIYQTTVVFSGNGRYVLSVSGTDICGNKAQTYTSESFLIDRTSPVVEIISDGQEKVNGWYYSSGRTLTIKITEDNFDASRINIKGADNRISEWKTNGNVHTAVVKFEDDGEYEFSVSGSDKAGNNFSEYNESFCIDTKATDIIFDGVKDKSANKGDVSLKILFEDKNHSPENISVSITGAQRGKIEISDDLFTKTDNGTMFMYNDFPFEKIYDDVYTVTAKAEDKAGNISEKTIIFSVNRFGSNYVFDEKALLIAGTYINNPVDILIHEINVDKLQNGKSIVLVKDSENITLSEGKDYTVNVSGGDGMWYDYEYIISSKCFSDDAAYIIIISSEDEAGNQNTTADKNKEAELKFGVDKTKPRCIPVNIESNHSYRADFMKVNFIVEDNILINEVNVYINGQTQKTEITNDGKNYYFTIESSDKPQNIIIKVSDMAGNETETIIENVLISPSLARVLVHKTWIKIVGTVSATGTVGGLLFWLKRRRI